MSRTVHVGPWEQGSISSGKAKRYLRGLVALAVLLVPLGMSGAAIAACAAPSATNCYGRYRGLYATVNETLNGTVLAEIQYGTDDASTLYNRNKRITGDPFGSRQMIEARFRDRQPSNGNSVYIWGRWVLNGSYCYTSMVGISAGLSQVGVQIGQGCTSGYHNAGDYEDQSNRYSDSAWHTSSNGLVQAFDLSSNSSRALVMPCEDQPFAPDDCVYNDAGRLLGVKY